MLRLKVHQDFKGFYRIVFDRDRGKFNLINEASLMNHHTIGVPYEGLTRGQSMLREVPQYGIPVSEYHKSHFYDLSARYSSHRGFRYVDF